MIKRHFILASNHVIAQNGAVAHGTRVLHPAPGTGSGNTILVAGVRDVFWEVSRTEVNLIDAALAWTWPSIVNGLPYGTYQFDPNPMHPAPEMAVVKYGATTGERFGVIEAIGQRQSFDYTLYNPSMGYPKFENLFSIEGVGADFSRPGDSGALVFEQSSTRPVGMIVGGYEFLEGGVKRIMTLASPIIPVLHCFSAKLWRQP